MAHDYVFIICELPYIIGKYITKQCEETFDNLLRRCSSEVYSTWSDNKERVLTWHILNKKQQNYKLPVSGNANITTNLSTYRSGFGQGQDSSGSTTSINTWFRLMPPFTFFPNQILLAELLSILFFSIWNQSRWFLIKPRISTQHTTLRMEIV